MYEENIVKYEKFLYESEWNVEPAILIHLCIISGKWLWGKKHYQLNNLWSTKWIDYDIGTELLLRLDSNKFKLPETVYLQ